MNTIYIYIQNIKYVGTVFPQNMLFENLVIFWRIILKTIDFQTHVTTNT